MKTNETQAVDLVLLLELARLARKDRGGHDPARIMQFQAERDGWTAERAQLEAERDEAIRLADAVTAELDEAREQIGQLRADASRLVSERAQAHAVAEERGRAAQMAQTEAHKAKEAAGEMLGQIRGLQDRIHEQIAQLTEANAKELRVIAQMDEARRDIERLKAENASRVRERDDALAAAEEHARTAQAAREDAETARAPAGACRGAGGHYQPPATGRCLA